MISSPLLSLFLVFLSLIWSECKGAYSPAPNCATYECPHYTVVHSTSDLEIRTYADAVWASSPSYEADSYLDAAIKGFKILFNYYKGDNKQHAKINVTVPVLVGIKDKSYTVYFYIPQKDQHNVPQPKDDLIKLVNLPRLKYVAVRRFGGFATDQNLPSQFAILRKSLEGTPYRQANVLNQTTLAAYNDPNDNSLNRVNEVMLWFDKLV